MVNKYKNNLDTLIKYFFHTFTFNKIISDTLLNTFYTLTKKQLSIL